MTDEPLDKHRLAGFDHRERGFSRPVEFERAGERYRAILRYESTCIVTDAHPSQDAALQVLIEMLQAQGYRQLKTQRSFRNGVYLGSQELWVEYPDQSRPGPPSGWLRRLISWFSPPRTNE